MPAAAAVSAAPSLSHLLASIWQRSVPLMRERLNILTIAASQTDAGYLTPAARQDASDIAHKLAGSLGMFGYRQGTEIARELEQLLDSEAPVLGRRLDELTSALRLSLPI